MATKVRKRFELDSNLLEDINPDTASAATIKEVQRALKLNRAHTKFQGRLEANSHAVGFETSSRSSKKDMMNFRELSSADLIKIIVHWKTYEPSKRDLARRFRIKTTLAFRITREYKKNPEYLAEVMLREQLLEEKRNAIEATVLNLQAAKRNIWTC